MKTQIPKNPLDIKAFFQWEALEEQNLKRKASTPGKNPGGKKRK
jgi:hypothetical protein